MKIEFLAHYKARHGYSLRDRLIAQLPDYSAVASRFAWLSNCRETVPGARAARRAAAGLVRQAIAAALACGYFLARPAREGWASREAVLEAASSGEKAAVLFVDTFNGTFERENAIAAGTRCCMQAAIWSTRSPGGGPTAPDTIAAAGPT